MGFSQRAELQLIDKALKNGWLTSDEKRAAVVQQLIDIISNPDTPDRNRMMAIKCLQSGERLSQGYMDLELKERMLDAGNGTVNILAIAAELNSFLAGRSPSGIESLPDALPDGHSDV